MWSLNRATIELHVFVICPETHKDQIRLELLDRGIEGLVVRPLIESGALNCHRLKGHVVVLRERGERAAQAHC